MEVTSDYWEPVYYLLQGQGFTCWLLSAKHVKNVSGRPKTGKLDAVWLASVVEAGMCRPSLVHPAPIRRLWDLTRYRRTLVRERTREKSRLELRRIDTSSATSPRWTASLPTTIYSARRGTYRVLYRINDTPREVFVLRIGHRRDAYRPS